MAWSKSKTAVVAGVVLILAAGTTTLMVVGTTYISSSATTRRASVISANRAPRIVTGFVQHSLVKSKSNSVVDDSFQQNSTVHITHAKQWALAAIMFADDHQGQLPEKFEQLKIGVSKELLADTNWEMVSGGNLNDFTNPPQTMLTILLREKESSRSPDGKFVKAYAFADGHTEMISSPDNDFAALEKQRGFLVHPAKN